MEKTASARCPAVQWHRVGQGHVHAVSDEEGISTMVFCSSYRTRICTLLFTGELILSWWQNINRDAHGAVTVFFQSSFNFSISNHCNTRRRPHRTLYAAARCPPDALSIDVCLPPTTARKSNPPTSLRTFCIPGAKQVT